MLVPRVAADISIRVVDPKAQPVVDAVISLVPLDGATPPLAPANAEVAQVNKEFVPRVTVVPLGSVVTFTNRDKVQHQIYSLSEPKKFEVALHRPGTETPVVFDKPGVVVFGCNIHDWMTAYIVVVPTPWFAKTDSAGAATLRTAAPAGRYRVEVWHARLEQPETRELTLPMSAAETPLTFRLTLKPDTRIRRGPAAAGGGYR
jgi:plastocyanin